MDILYYSNYCKHSKKIISVLSRSNKLKETISFICIDNRYKDNKTNQEFIRLENGSRIVKPPNLHSVPALLLIKENFTILYGDDIIEKIKPVIISDTEEAVMNNGEPLSYQFTNNNNVISEKYTFCDLSNEELSAKGIGGKRNMHHYVTVDHSNITINTPDDDYKPDKIGNNITIDNLITDRQNSLEQNQKPPQLDFY